MRVRKPGIGISEVQLIQVAGNRRWWLTTSVTQSLVLNRYRHPKSSIAHGEPMNEAVPNTPWTVDRLQYTFSNGIRLIRLSMAMICPVEHVRRLHPTRISSAHSMSDFQALVKVVGSTGPRIAVLPHWKHSMRGARGRHVTMQLTCASKIRNDEDHTADSDFYEVHEVRFTISLHGCKIARRKQVPT